MTTTTRKYAASAVAAVALVALGASTASAEPAEKGRTPSVGLKGSARIHYAPSPQDRVHVSFDAHATYPEWGQDPGPGKAGGVADRSQGRAGRRTTSVPSRLIEGWTSKSASQS